MGLHYMLCVCSFLHGRHQRGQLISSASLSQVYAHTSFLLLDPPLRQRWTGFLRLLCGARLCEEICIHTNATTLAMSEQQHFLQCIDVTEVINRKTHIWNPGLDGSTRV
eukprot:c19980_g1_i2 orf=102-428(+)